MPTRSRPAFDRERAIQWVLMTKRFEPGDLAVVRILKKNFLVTLVPGGVLHTNKGYIRHDDVIGKAPGARLATNLGKPAWAFEPTLTDVLMAVHRHTTIAYPKDIGRLVFALGVNAGRRVLEAGTGSGALSIALAYFVRPTGRVVSYERRDDFAERARTNLERAGLADFVEVRAGDLAGGVPADERGAFDACVLDMPEPWHCLDAVHDALKPGGGLAVLLPTVNQVERLHRALRSLPFLKPETEEVLVRTWDVKDGATRPDFRMIGHTLFLTLTRTLSDREEAEESDE